MTNMLIIILLECLAACPLLGVVLCLFTPSSRTDLLKDIALVLSLLSFLFAFIIWFFLNDGVFFIVSFWFYNSDIGFILPINSTSTIILMAITIFPPLCLMWNWDSEIVDTKLFIIVYLLMDFLIICTFLFTYR